MLPKFKLPKIELSPLRQINFILREVAKLLWATSPQMTISLVIVNIINSLTILPTLYLDKYFIDTIVSNIGKPWQPVLHVIFFIVLFRFINGTVKSVTNRLIGYYNRFLSRRLADKIDALIGEKYSQIDVSLIEDPKFKDRYSKVEREGSSRAFPIVSSFADLPLYISGIISALSIFIFFQPWLAVLSIGFLVPILIVDAKFIKLDYQIETELSSQYRMRSMLGYYLIRSRSYLELRLLRIGNYLVKKLSGVQEGITGVKQKMVKSRVATRSLVSLPQDIFFYSLDIYFAFLAIIRQITIGSSQAYVRAVATFRDNLGGLVGAFLQFYENYLYVSDLVWFLNLQPKQNPQFGKAFPKRVHAGITFEHVWFKYPESDNWILKDVNFIINPTENIALIGENGAGKTTLVKLLAGFYEPTQGKINIDGVAINKYRLDDYWKSLSILFQDFEAYDFTARESIGYGNVDKLNKLPEIRKYAKMTDIDRWIESLPLKYENSLSRHYEKGVSPSSGQWQRIGLARTLIKNSQILVLDEPTSNVDPQAEEDIFNQVLKLGKEKILIFISHRFSTVRRADKILLLEGGKITEQGTHDQLMQLDKKYAQLFHLQAKSYQ
ncbi:MAG: ABC transporter ATP-binding protein [Patescibacteria group bacterium]